MSTQPKPQEQRYWRLVAERKGAQELRTPQPVSIKRLEKAWGS